MNIDTKYDVVIIGGGVTGTALLYVLSTFTNIQKIALFEKHSSLGAVNTSAKNNSQTLHVGDIETNYSLEKARHVKKASTILANYLERDASETFIKGGKMVLGVGGSETDELEKRFEEFKELFPELKKIYREEIAEIEPNVVLGRDAAEKIVALYTQTGYTVDYQKLSESFVKKALQTGKTIDVYLDTEITKILRNNEDYVVSSAKNTVHTHAIAVTAGPHSLVFAKALGYGAHLGLLPVAGSFYYTDKPVLNGKVYTNQIKKLPFAAIHGDPEITDTTMTRFGPTAKVLPLLERHDYTTMYDFMRTSAWNVRGIISLFSIIADWTLFSFVLKNIAYDLPVIGRWFFLKSAQKIVPTLKYSDIHFGDNLGGIRPQIVNTTTRKMEMGEAEIVGDKILFNITPSPGASVCLKTALLDAWKVIGFLGEHYTFDTQKWLGFYPESHEILNGENIAI